MPDEGIGCGFTEAVRGVLSHHMVIKGGKIANYHPYPPTPWNANPRDIYGTPGPYEDAVHGHADLRGERPRASSRASTSCGPCAASIPCLPCGVHMYLGKGKVLKKVHSPTQARPRRAGLSRGLTEPLSATGTDRPPGDRRPDRALLDELRAPPTRAPCDQAEELLAPGHRAVRRRPGAGRRAGRGRGARAARRALVDDELVGSLLVVHGLHPDDLGARVERPRWSRCGPFLAAPRRRRRAARHRRGGRRRAPAAARQLRRLPVVGGHAAARRSSGPSSTPRRRS